MKIKTMDLSKEKEALVKDYNNNAEIVQRLNGEIQRLNSENLQILGAIRFIEKMEKQNADAKPDNTTEST